MSVLPAVDSLLARAESVLARLEAVLPHAATAPDWAASVAFRYRRRGSGCVLEPVRHVASIRLARVAGLVGQGGDQDAEDDGQGTAVACRQQHGQ